jgi:NodT family efflux transporter outer membrane factor (OMF) lipoprotein
VTSRFRLELAGLAACALVATGCAVGPDYARPKVDLPAAFKEGEGWQSAVPRDQESRGEWWKDFGQPELDAFEHQAANANLTLAAAEAQYRQARALDRAARAAYLPGVTAAASGTRSKSPIGTVGSPNVGNAPVTVDTLQLDATWEADLWGRVRRSVESSTATAQASYADMEAAKLLAQATVAQDYFLVRTADRQIALLKDAVAAYRKSLQLTQNRYKAGVAQKTDVVQAETQLRQTEAQLVDAGVQRAQLEHAIAVLVGRAPANFAIAPNPLEFALPRTPPGVPSELLQRRPDIAGAERRMAAANAQIGVAQAAFFPTLTLSGSAGFRNTRLSDLLTSASRLWSFGPSLAASVFDAGLRESQKEAALAAYDATVAQYKQTVLVGMQEVEDNLAALRLLEQELSVQADAVKAARESVRLTENQYKAGTVSYLNVIQAETIALSNEQTAVNLLGRQATAAVLLVKALGGGWRYSGADLAGERPAETIVYTPEGASRPRAAIKAVQ